MRASTRLAAAALGLALAGGAEARAQPPEAIGWPEAVARLAAERQRAVTCAGLARGLSAGDAAASLAASYGEAKAEMDGVVAGLAVALAQGSGRGAPALPDLERRLEAGFAKREAFCRRVLDLSPPAPPGQRERGPLGDLVGGVAKPLVEAAVAIWTRAADEDRLRRDTIRAQLEATRWPAYGDVPPSR
jgi:hypothetical protein